MEMNQIRYFLAVCEHRNFTHAAKASNVSQPSLTTAIKKLENELGGPLFLRDRAGCSLTPLGKLVGPRLKKVQRETQEIKAEATRHNRLERVPISIGIGETIGQNKIAKALEQFRRQIPEAEVELIVDSHDALLEKLRHGVYDIAVTAIDVSPDLYRIDPLYQEGYSVVVSSDHALSQKTAVNLGILAQTNMLDRPNCEMRDTLHETCSERGHELYAAYRSNRVDWLLDLARNGSGAVILPNTSIPQESSLVSLPIEDMEIARQVYALRSRHQPTRSEVRLLVQELAR